MYSVIYNIMIMKYLAALGDILYFCNVGRIIQPDQYQWLE